MSISLLRLFVDISVEIKNDLIIKIYSLNLNIFCLKSTMTITVRDLNT